jgi:hypothetical protein
MHERAHNEQSKIKYTTRKNVLLVIIYLYSTLLQAHYRLRVVIGMGDAGYFYGPITVKKQYLFELDGRLTASGGHPD